MATDQSDFSITVIVIYYNVRVLPWNIVCLCVLLAGGGTLREVGVVNRPGL